MKQSTYLGAMPSSGHEVGTVSYQISIMNTMSSKFVDLYH